MRCLLCASWSIQGICEDCQNTFLNPQLHTKTIASIPIYSFYEYEDIEFLLLSKYYDIGCLIYKILTSVVFKIFKDNINLNRHISLIPIDDKIKKGFSHTAVIAKELEYKKTKAQFNTLLNKSLKTYHGKSLSYRLENPRLFYINKKINTDVILIDDILTTGLTLQNAVKVLQKNNINVLFCITLAYVKEK